VKLERKLAGVAIQGTVSRMGEVSLLAFDPAKGSAGLVDLSATTDIELLQAGGHSWMPEQPYPDDSSRWRESRNDLSSDPERRGSS
jgi:hypothetical protein